MPTHRLLPAVVLTALVSMAWGGAAAARTAPMPTIRASGSHLRAGGRTFHVFGFNYTFGTHTPEIDYFANPTAHGLRVVTADFAKAARMGANTMRIFLALPEFMQDATRPRPAALRALRRVIHVAERDGIYLDITGDIVWKLPQDAGWYDLLPEAERWQVQARFWQAVARVAARSPAVLTYELTNEPAICVNEPSWYAAPVQGLLYVQCVVRTLNDRDAYGLAQAWTRDLRAAIRAEDRTHLVSIGLLPVPNGSFGPQNMAGLLGLLTVHDFPEDGRLDGYVNTIRQFAKPGRPVLLGETFLLKSSAQTWRRYLLRTRRWVVGTLTFFDGRTPAEDKGRTLADVMYRDSLTEYLGLRAALLR